MSALFEIRDKYPRDIEKEIKLYSIDKKGDGARVIGSLSYKSGNASDVDLYETIFRDNKEAVINLFVSNIKKMTKEINQMKDNFFLEVKCGINHLYYIDFGKCKNNIYTVNNDFFQLMDIYFKKKLLNNDEYKLIKDIQSIHNKNQLHFELIQKIMRGRYILRWNSSEIHSGYKILKTLDGKEYKYTLEDGVVEKSNINIEGIFITGDNKFSEVSNFFVLEYEDKGGRKNIQTWRTRRYLTLKSLEWII